MDSEQNADTVHQQHDTSYKFLLSSKKLFIELLRSFVDRGWVQAVNEEQLEQIPHSFILQDFNCLRLCRLYSTMEKQNGP